MFLYNKIIILYIGIYISHINGRIRRALKVSCKMKKIVNGLPYFKEAIFQFPHWFLQICKIISNIY